MRRLGFVALLAVFLAGVLFLLLETTGGGVERKSAAALAAEAAQAENAGPADDGAAGAKGGPDAEPAPDDDPNRVPGPDVDLRGRVVRGDAGVPGAAVVVTRARPRTQVPGTGWWRREFEGPSAPVARATADAGGHFSVRFPRRTRFVVHASAPGHGGARRLVFVPDEGDPPEVELRLGDPHEIIGRVVTTAGEPVAGAAITIANNDWRLTNVALAATTDAQGGFRVPDLAAGAYRVRCAAEGYPEVTHHASLPQRTHVEFVLGERGVVLGTVYDGRDRPLAGATVLVLMTGAAGRGQARGLALTDAHGAYRIEPALPGSIAGAIIAHPAVGEATSYRSQIRLPTQLLRDGKELRFDIRLKPGVPVRGRAVMAGSGAPAKGVAVALLQMNTQWRGLNAIAEAVTAPDGAFEFPYVTEGSYAIEATGTFVGRRVSRYAQAGRPVTIDFYVDGTNDVAAQRIELEPVGNVRGRIVSESRGPRSQSNVNVQIESQWVSGQVDDLGFFELLSLPPTEQAVVQTWNPQAKSDPFAIEAGETAWVELDQTREGEFRGVVEDEEGRPVSGAAVKVIADPQLKQELQRFANGQAWGAVRTGRDGRYQVGALEWQRRNYKTQKWTVVALRAGYLLGVVGDLKLPREGQSVETRVVLAKGGAVSGRVVFEGGGPASGLQVTVSPKPEKGAPVETRGNVATYTRFDGSFEIGGVGPGVYLASVFYADGKAEAREVAAGDTGVLLELRPTEFIAGAIVGPDGEPVTRAQVYAIIPGARTEEKRHGTLTNGRFRINHLEPGAYAVAVGPPKDRYGGQASGPVTKTTRIPPVRTGRDDVVIEIPPGPSISGHVTDENNRPIPAAGVVAMPLEIKPADRQQSWNIARPAAVTNGRGEFAIRNLGENEVELIALAAGYQPATLKAVPGASDVRLRLRKGEAIEGRILKTDGTPLASQWLNVQPADQAIQARLNDWQSRGGQTYGNLGGWQLSSASTNGSGEFRFNGLMPGEYRLNLTTEHGVLPQGTLRTGAAPVVLRLQPALTIRGRVLDPDGNPPVPDPGQMIWVNAQVDNRHVGSTSADADGYFELKGLPAGEISVYVWAGQKYQYRNLKVTAGEQNLVVRLEAKAAKKPPK